MGAWRREGSRTRRGRLKIIMRPDNPLRPPNKHVRSYDEAREKVDV
jgi:hypothetical protein